MTSRFRNELTIVPPVRIEVTRGGLATTINWAASGTDRRPTSAKVSFGVVGDPRLSGPLPTDRYLIPGTRIDFGCGDVRAMTSAGLSDFKALLVATREREREIRSDMRKAKRQLALSWMGRALAWTTLAPAVSTSLRIKMSTTVALRRSEVSTLKGNLASSRLSISFDMDTAVAEPHRRMLAAFDELCRSQRSWVLQTAQRIDRVRARSAAEIVVAPQKASLGRRADAAVDTNDLPLALTIQGGKATAYFYPGFVLIVSVASSDFAVIDLKELMVSYGASRFTETGPVPSDAAMVGKVWAKSNKNGTRDKRFKHNRELPVMLYGEIGLSAPGGMSEVFMFSRNDACHEFVSAVNDLKRILASPQDDTERAQPKTIKARVART